MSFSLSGRVARLAFVLLFASPFTYGAQRTFVSTAGNDANACSLPMPCRSFSRALAVTDPAGEIVVLDSGGYGAVSIAQSVTITVPDGIYAGISVFSNSGVLINAPGINVTLRGLAINFQGGSFGVGFVSGRSLVVDQCRISGAFTAGISQVIGSGSMFVRDTVIAGTSASGDGIDTASAATLERVTISGVGGTGIVATDFSNVTVRDSIVNGAGASGIYAVAQIGGTVKMFLDGVTIARSVVSGVDTQALGPGSTAYVDIVRAHIVHNGSSAASSIAQAFGYTNVHISDSQVSDNGYGLVTSFAGQLTSSGNTVVSNGRGFEAYAPNGMFSMGNNQVRDNGPPNIDGSVTVLTYN
jgi:hypothetical protein